jgi:RNA polymerase sigma-70 factor (ECF subfamily)
MKAAAGKSEWMGARTFDEGFSRVFAGNYGALHRYVHRRLGPDLADEIAAETFATAYANWSRFDRSRPVRPWLYGIAANLLRHHYRAEERKLRAYARTGVDPFTDGPDEAAVPRLDAQRQQRSLAAALAALRAPEREVLLLHAWAELSDEEVAAALSLPRGTVKSRLSRAREHVRNQLCMSGQEEGEETEATDGSRR